MAELVSGAYLAAAHATARPPLLGESTAVVYPDGHTSTPSTGIIDAPSMLPVHTEAWIRRQIMEHARGDSRVHGVEVAFVHAYGPVPIVTVRFAPREAFPIAMDAVRPIFGDPSAYEGLLLRVVETSGRLVRVVGMANGTGARLGVDPR